MADLHIDAGRWVRCNHDGDVDGCILLDLAHIGDQLWLDAKMSAARDLEHLRPPERNAYVVTGRYSDGSGACALAVCLNESVANRLMSILVASGPTRELKLETVPFDGSTEDAHG